MTCILGLMDSGKVWMAGDSAGVGGYDIRTRNDTKVFINGPYIMGFTSSFRMGQLLRFSLHVPHQDPDHTDEQHMMTTFIDAVRQCLKDGGCAKVDSNQEEGGEFLVGYKGQLYAVYQDFQISIPSKMFEACGCGEDYAVGALAALMGHVKIGPDALLHKTLGIVEEFSAGVRGPFTVLSL